MKRHKAREIVFTMLFEADFNKELIGDDIYQSALENYEMGNIAEEPYIKDTFYRTMENLEEIDAIIAAASKGWSSERISYVSRAVLRLAICEMKYGDKLPAQIAGNEAVEISKKYDDEKAFSFVNGVIRKVADTIEAQ